jgi:hypothetical protein
VAEGIHSSHKLLPDFLVAQFIPESLAQFIRKNQHPILQEPNHSLYTTFNKAYFLRYLLA